MTSGVADSSRRAVAVFRWLLNLYPVAFRREYQEKLILLFQDQLRDAKARRTKGAIFVFWVRMLVDTGCSAGREHGNALRRVLSSGSPTAVLLHFFPTPGRGICSAWITGVLVSIGLKLWMPVLFVASTNLQFVTESGEVVGDPRQLEFYAEQVSESKTLEYIVRLQYPGSSDETIQSEVAGIRRHLRVRRSRNWCGVRIEYTAHRAVDAATMANRITDALQARRLRDTGRQDVEIVDPALPPLRSMTPDLKGTLIRGTLLGIIAGCPLALGIACLRIRMCRSVKV